MRARALVFFIGVVLVAPGGAPQIGSHRQRLPERPITVLSFASRSPDAPMSQAAIVLEDLRDRPHTVPWTTAAR